MMCLTQPESGWYHRRVLALQLMFSCFTQSPLQLVLRVPIPLRCWQRVRVLTHVNRAQIRRQGAALPGKKHRDTKAWKPAALHSKLNEVRGWGLAVAALGFAQEGATLQFVYFCGEDEIAFGEAVDLMRPSGDYGFAPAEENVWMMALGFGDFADFINEGECLNKIRELECARDVVAIDNLPLRDLF
jgi:hypothetical protein